MMRAAFLLTFFVASGWLHAYAVPYNVQNGFCLDKASYYSSRYERAKIYNTCMQNAENLIRQHEEQKRRMQLQRERSAQEQNRRAAQRERERKAAELKSKQEERENAIKRELEEQRQIRFYEDMFKKFN